jgi:hypothetical protein
MQNWTTAANTTTLNSLSRSLCYNYTTRYTTTQYLDDVHVDVDGCGGCEDWLCSKETPIDDIERMQNGAEQLHRFIGRTLRIGSFGNGTGGLDHNGVVEGDQNIGANMW